jgi:hypothetical protein
MEPEIILPFLQIKCHLSRILSENNRIHTLLPDMFCCDHTVSVVHPVL